jgi:hypothetical protein
MPNPMPGAGAGAVKMPAITQGAPGYNPMNAVPVTLGYRKSIPIMFHVLNLYPSMRQQSVNFNLLDLLYIDILTDVDAYMGKIIRACI